MFMYFHSIPKKKKEIQLKKEREIVPSVARTRTNTYIHEFNGTLNERIELHK